ncbi:MAG: penicillin acylase family protein [Caldilineaceae bacterium]
MRSAARMALDVAGASLPGVPGVFIGHNAAVAWGVTNALVDVQDLCLERLHPEKRGVFAVPGGWEPACVRTEEIAVRRATHVEKVVHRATARSSPGCCRTRTTRPKCNCCPSLCAGPARSRGRRCARCCASTRPATGTPSTRRWPTGASRPST